MPGASTCPPLVRHGLYMDAVTERCSCRCGRVNHGLVSAGIRNGGNGRKGMGAQAENVHHV
jgi:hypothetical protein